MLPGEFITMKLLFIIAGLIALSTGQATDSLSYQVCEIGKPSLGEGIQSATGTGEGCKWQPAGSKNLEAFVHFTGMKETVAGVKEMMDASAVLPSFKRVSLGICQNSEIMSGDYQNGEGPGGVAYVDCGERVFIFSFQGSRACEQVRPLAKRLSEAKFAR